MVVMIIYHPTSPNLSFLLSFAVMRKYFIFL